MSRAKALYGALAAFTIALSAVAAGDSTLSGDAQFERFVQRAPDPPAAGLADLGNNLGSAPVCTLLSVLLIGGLLVVRRPGPALFLLAVNTARSINTLLKLLYDSPRPTADLVEVRGTPNGLGFPSGHAMGAMLFYGAISIVATELVPVRALRIALRVICWLIIVLVGFGRIYSGAHWPSDVFGGYLYGTIVLVCVHLVAVRIRQARRARAGG